MATTVKTHERELPVELPQSAAAFNIEQEPDLLIVGVDRNGQPYLGPEPVSTERLHQRLKEASLKNPQQRIRIDGDRDTAFQHVVHILDLCEFEGLRNVGIHTRK